MKPTRSKITILKQIVSHISGYLVTNLARKHGIMGKCRSFSPWSHVVSMVYVQLSHSLSLNDVCDSLSNHGSALATLRRATAPSQNGLSHSNRVRNADMAEVLLWGVLHEYQREHPQFGMGGNYVGFPRRFERIINVVDSTTMKLVAGYLDWAKHRRRKAAARCHMRLDVQTFLPHFALANHVRVATMSGSDQQNCPIWPPKRISPLFQAVKRLLRSDFARSKMAAKAWK